MGRPEVPLRSPHRVLTLDKHQPFRPGEQSPGLSYLNISPAIRVSSQQEGARMSDFDRRDFFKTAGLTGLALAPQAAAARPLTEKQKLDRLASNTWPVRQLFKSRTGFGRSGGVAETLKKKYGEITMLDFPQFTKDTFPGVTHMDLFSGLFGDVADDSMYVKVPVFVGTQTRVTQEFDPSTD